MTDETWLSVSDAAAILRLSQRQVHRYGVAGRIKTRRAGARIVYLAADVAALADEMQVAHRPPPRSTALTPEARAYLAQVQANQQAIEQRLDRIESRVSQPTELHIPRTIQIAAAVLAVAVILTLIVVLVLAMRS